MNAFDSIFDGLYGYEKLMLVCGPVLFVFALAVITAMIVQRRDFKMAMVLSIWVKPAQPGRRKIAKELGYHDCKRTWR